MKQEMTNNPNIEAMFRAGAHFGYTKSRRHPSVKPFIFGVKNRTEIIDLAQVDKMLEKAKAFVSKLGSEGKQIMFVGNKAEARTAVMAGAERIGMPFSRERWIGGTFTNFVEIRKRVARMEELEQKKARNELSMYTKKEQLVIGRELASVQRFFSGIVNMKSIPAAIFIIDPKKESTAYLEAQKLGVPVIALAGSDCDVSGIDYPIVANDSSVSSINYFVGEIVSAYEDGKRNPVAAPTQPSNNDNNGAN